MEVTMKRTFLAAMAVATLAATGASRAAAVPAEAIRDLRSASQQLEEAALLRNVASDKTEAQHLLAARDLLREAEPQLDWTQRLQATMLEHEIGRDILFADEADTMTLSLPIQPSTEARVERDDLSELAKRGADLANQTAIAAGETPAAKS
jgi:hypothetical protein